jgi:hypothetical protein
MKLYVMHVNLELHFRNSLSNAKMSYVLSIDLVEWKKLAIHDFLSRGRLWFQKRAYSCENLKF